MAVIQGTLDIFSYTGLDLLFYIPNLVYYGLSLYFTGLAYKAFRLTGGIHGGQSKTDREKGHKKGSKK